MPTQYFLLVFKAQTVNQSERPMDTNDMQIIRIVQILVGKMIIYQTPTITRISSQFNLIRTGCGRVTVIDYFNFPLLMMKTKRF